MKIRNGFVSNSSSSSFIISKSVLSQEQIEAIRDHINYTKNNFPDMIGKSLGKDTYNWAWKILENNEYILGNVDMDGFEMSDFLEKIGIDKSNFILEVVSGNIHSFSDAEKIDIAIVENVMYVLFI